jgi:hypothetical protein
LTEQFSYRLHHGQIVIDQQDFRHCPEANSKAPWRASGFWVAEKKKPGIEFPASFQNIVPRRASRQE